MPIRREEVLRRLGSRRFREVCPSCKAYVPALQLAHIWEPVVSGGGIRRVQVCAACAQRIEQQNQAFVRREAQNQVQLELANREHIAAAHRSSSAEYLAACERMRREGW